MYDSTSRSNSEVREVPEVRNIDVWPDSRRRLPNGGRRLTWIVTVPFGLNLAPILLSCPCSSVPIRELASTYRLTDGGNPADLASDPSDPCRRSVLSVSQFQPHGKPLVFEAHSARAPSSPSATAASLAICRLWFALRVRQQRPGQQG